MSEFKRESKQDCCPECGSYGKSIWNSLTRECSMCGYSGLEKEDPKNDKPNPTATCE